MTVPRNAHIAMFSIAAHGHVNPSIEVIRELVARGHRVTYAIPPQFAEKVAETGAEPKIWHSTLPTDDDPDAWGTELIDHLEPFLTDAVQALPQLIDLYEDDEPDLVLYDITAYPARVLAHRWNVPIVQFSPNLVAWEGYEEEVGKPMFEPLKQTPRGKAFYENFEHWIRSNGIDRSVEDFMGRPDRCLVLIPKALQPNADRVDESRYTFVGACQGERAAQAEWQRPVGAENVLLVSLGSSFTKQPAFYRACIEAFGDLPGWHVVLQVGKFVDEEELGEIPANVEVHHWVPQPHDPQAGRRLHHARGRGRQPGGPRHRDADGRGPAGRRPVRQRRHAPGARRRTPRTDGGGHGRQAQGDRARPGVRPRGGAPPPGDPGGDGGRGRYPARGGPRRAVRRPGSTRGVK